MEHMELDGYSRQGGDCWDFGVSNNIVKVGVLMQYEFSLDLYLIWFPNLYQTLIKGCCV